MTDESTYTTDENENNEEVEEKLDFSKVLADVKQLTAWAEETSKQLQAQNQYLTEILSKIEKLTDWNLWKKATSDVFQSFWQNFRNYLKANLTKEQVKIIRDDVERLIDAENFEDNDLELQMNKLYTMLDSFTEPEKINIEIEESPVVEDQKPDLQDVEKNKEETKEEPEATINTESTWSENIAEPIHVEKKTKPKEVKDKTVEKNSKRKDKLSKPAESLEDIKNNRECLKKYIIDKEFPWKGTIEKMIEENDQTQKEASLKLIQLQMIPYYDWHIDGIMSKLTLTAIQKYITKNLNKKWNDILKKDNSNVARYDTYWNLINKVDELSIVIKWIGNSKLWQAYFLDYQDFGYTVETDSRIIATIWDYNYCYDISTNKLEKQTWSDSMQEVKNETILQEYLRILLIAITKK